MKTILLATALLSTAMAVAPASAQTVILVRHAEKAADSGDPPLAPAGAERATALADALADSGLDLVLTSHLRRTLETAAPAATRHGLAPQAVAIVNRDLAGHFQAVADKVRAAGPDQTVLVVGHSNTVPAIIAALGGPRLPDIPDCAYDRLFVLRLGVGGATLVQGRYGTPSPGCPAG